MYIGLNCLGLSSNKVGVSAFSPASVFTGNAAGIWLDPSITSSSYQPSDGTILTGASGNPVGLLLDQRQALGSEIISSITPTAYNANGTISVVGDVVTCTCTTNGTYGARFAVGSSTNTQSWYRVSVNITSNSASRGAFLYGNVTTGIGAFVNGPTGVVSGYDQTSANSNGDSVIFISGLSGESFTFSLSSFSVKRHPGNHVVQATTTARPLFNLNTGVYSDVFDGVDDGLDSATFTAGTLTGSMDLFVAIKRTNTNAGILAFKDPAFNGSYVGAFNSGSGVDCCNAAGAAWTALVDGISVGGPGVATQGALNTALTSATWHIAEIRGLDLSSFTGFCFGNSTFAGFTLAANLGGVILCPAQSTATRNKLRTWLGAKVGLSL